MGDGTKLSSMAPRFLRRFGIRTLLMLVAVVCIAIRARQIYVASEAQNCLLHTLSLKLDADGKPLDYPLFAREVYFGNPSDSATWINIDDEESTNTAGLKGILRKLIGEECFRSLVVLNISRQRIDSALHDIRATTTLRGIYCRECDCDDALLATMIDALPDLTRLDISMNPVTDKGMTSIGSLRRLTHLDLHALEGLTDSGILRLTELQSLRELSIRSTGVTLASLCVLSTFPQLEMLACSLPAPGEKYNGEFHHLKSVRRLWVDSAEFGDKHLRDLSQCQLIEEVRLDGTAATVAGLQHLPNPKLIRTLCLDGQRNQSISGLSRFSGLRWLGLQKLSAQPQELANLLVKMPDLQVLDLEGYTGINAGVMMAISQLTQLKALNLAHTNVSDKDINMLLQLAELRYLNVKDTEISGVAVQRLRGLGALWFLTPAAASELSNCLIRELQHRRFPGRDIRTELPFANVFEWRIGAKAGSIVLSDPH